MKVRSCQSERYRKLTDMDEIDCIVRILDSHSAGDFWKSNKFEMENVIQTMKRPIKFSFPVLRKLKACKSRMLPLMTDSDYLVRKSN